jgi:hypothetical protein
MNNKMKLYKLFEKINKLSLNEYYDFNPKDEDDIKELFRILAIKGIPDWKELETPHTYPKSLFNGLEKAGYIKRDVDNVWRIPLHDKGDIQKIKGFSNFIKNFDPDMVVPKPKKNEPEYAYGSFEESKKIIKESVLPKDQRINLIKEFVKSYSNEFGLKKIPNITLSFKPDEAKINTSFGQYSVDNEKIRVVCNNRNLADILRTIAHELYHRIQDQTIDLNDESGETGSDVENQANAMAGIALRNFGKLHPEIYE